MRDTRGFSLIEVLVVIAIIGVLSGISIAQYAGYRARGYDTKVAATVRGVATGEEAYYAQHQAYAASVVQIDHVGVGDVAITIAAGNSGDLQTSFKVIGTHPNATRSYTWLSDPTPGQPNLLEN